MRKMLLAALVLGSLALGASFTGCGTAAGGGAGGPAMALGFTPGHEPAGVLPLAVTRPVLNPAVTDADLDRTVCTGTSRYRPPRAYTDEVKRIELSTPVGSSGSIADPRTGRVYAVPGYRGYAGLGPRDAARVELDHFLPLSDGGDGYDPANLWPEIGGTAGAALAGADGQPADSHAKDGLEDYVYRRLCPHGSARRTMTLEQAQALYEPDWYASYVRLGRPSGSGG